MSNLSPLVVSAIAQGADPTGVADCTSAINGAIAVAQTARVYSATILFAPGTYKISGNITVPIGVVFQMNPGAILSPDSGKIITFQGRIEVLGDNQCFAGSGAIVFAPNSNEFVHPDWWDPTVTSASCSLQKACDAAHPAQIPVVLYPKVYSLASGAVGLSITNPYATITCKVAPTSSQFAITNATNATPIVLTLGGSGIVNGFTNGAIVQVTGVTGNTGANGNQFTITAVASPNVTLAGSVGTGMYASGGVMTILQGANLQYSGTGTAVQVGVSVGVSQDFITGLYFRNWRVVCLDNCAIGLRLWSPLKSRIEQVNCYGISGSSNVVCQVEGSQAVDFVDCDWQGQGTASTATNYAIVLKQIGAGGTPSTTTRYRSCYIHYGSVLVLVDNSFCSFHHCVTEAGIRGMQIQNGATVQQYDQWYEGLGGPATAGELFGSIDATSFWGLNECTYNVAGDCRKMFTTAAGCTMRIDGGRFLGGAGNYVIFFGSEIGATSDVKIRGWNLTGVGGVYNSTDTRSVLGETPTWQTVMWEDLHVVRYDFVYSTVAANLTAAFLNCAGTNTPDQNWKLIGDPNAPAGPGRILGMSWDYSNSISAGTYDIKTYLSESGAPLVLNSGASSAATGTVMLSALSTSWLNGAGLAVSLDTSADFNLIGGTLVVSVWVGYGDVCDA